MQNIKDLIAQTDLTKPAGIPDRVELHPFVASWRWTYDLYRPVHEEMLASALCFASDILDGNPPRWLSFLGASGVGKTFLMKQVVRCLRAAANAVDDHGARVWVTKTKTGFSTPRAARVIPSADLDSYLAPREFASEFEVIYVEDIGAALDLDKGSAAVVRSRVAELLQLRSKAWTLIDANLSIAQIEATFDGRLASRLRRDGSTCIVVPDDTPDYSLLEK